MVISILAGLVAGYIFVKCYLTAKTEYHGPNSKEIVGNIYKWRNGKYYQFSPEICVCPLR